jgi:hypothetical protein
MILFLINDYDQGLGFRDQGAGEERKIRVQSAGGRKKDQGAEYRGQGKKERSGGRVQRAERKIRGQSTEGRENAGTHSPLPPLIPDP